MKFNALAAAVLGLLLVAVAFGTADERRPSTRRSSHARSRKADTPPTRVQKAESPDDVTAPPARRSADRETPRQQTTAARRVVSARTKAAESSDASAPVPQTGPAAQAPTPEQAAEARELAARLMRCVESGAVALTREDRERAQVQQLVAQGYCSDPGGRPVGMAPELMRTVVRLAERSSPEKPLVVLSLYRPLSPGRPREPHGNGMAVDIAAYAGHRIDSHNPDECVEGVLAIVKALTPGSYRFGLPRPPDSEPAALLPPPERPEAWPFFPAPVPEVIEPLGLVAPRVNDGKFVLSSRGGVRAQVLRWENERYAPLADIGSPRVRSAIEKAIAQGVNIHSLFPDGVDHLHLDVKPQP